MSSEEKNPYNRRDFLQTAAVLGGALLLPSQVEGSATLSDKVLPGSSRNIIFNAPYNALHEGKVWLRIKVRKPSDPNVYVKTIHIKVEGDEIDPGFFVTLSPYNLPYVSTYIRLEEISIVRVTATLSNGTKYVARKRIIAKKKFGGCG